MPKIEIVQGDNALVFGIDTVPIPRRSRARGNRIRIRPTSAGNRVRNVGKVPETRTYRSRMRAYGNVILNASGVLVPEDRTAEFARLEAMVDSGEPVSLAVDDRADGEWHIGNFRDDQGEIAMGLPLYIDWTMELTRIE